MIIDNDTSEPVDYDIDVAGGGTGMMDETGSGVSATAGKPRFALGPGDQLDFNLADAATGATCRHTFLIQQTIGSTQAKTVVEMRDAPADMQRVTLTSAVADGETFYRINLAKS